MNERLTIQDLTDLLAAKHSMTKKDAEAFVKEFLKNELSLAEGVKLPLIQGLEWKYATFPFAPIGEWKVPEAGYFKIETGDLTINYLPYVLD